MNRVLNIELATITNLGGRIVFNISMACWEVISLSGGGIFGFIAEHGGS